MYSYKIAAGNNEKIVDYSCLGEKRIDVLGSINILFLCIIFYEKKTVY